LPRKCKKNLPKSQRGGGKKKKAMVSLSKRKKEVRRRESVQTVNRRATKGIDTLNKTIEIWAGRGPPTNGLGRAHKEGQNENPGESGRQKGHTYIKKRAGHRVVAPEPEKPATKKVYLRFRESGP